MNPKIPRDIPDDVLPEQIVEDENGNIKIIPAEWLLAEDDEAKNPLTQNELAVENMENDLPCTDVENFGSQREFSEAME